MLDITFDAFPVIKTERLVLRQMLENDAEALFELRSDPVMMQYFDRPLMASMEEALQFVTTTKQLFSENNGLQWAITLADNPQMIGTISFWKIDKAHHRGEVGYMLGAAHQHKGLMQEALAAVLDYGFRTLRLHTVEANVNPANEASIKLLEKIGFVREAYFRENYYFEGKFLDTGIYSLRTPI